MILTLLQFDAARLYLEEFNHPLLPDCQKSLSKAIEILLQILLRLSGVVVRLI